MAGPANRGKVTGRMLGGLLTGILLSRTISGFIASAASWRTVYLIAVIFSVSIGRSTSIKIAQNSDTYSNFKSINLFRFFEKSS